MKRAPQAPSPPVTAASGEILQLKVWLMNISPMVWRRLLVPVDCTLRELHGRASGFVGDHAASGRESAAPSVTMPGNQRSKSDLNDPSSVRVLERVIDSGH